MPKSLDKIASHPIIAGQMIQKHGGGIEAGGELTRSNERLQEKNCLKEEELRKIDQGRCQVLLQLQSLANRQQEIGPLSTEYCNYTLKEKKKELIHQTRQI